MASIPSSLEYTPFARHTVVGDPRWIALCGSLRGKPVSHLRDMAESSFDRLEADLGHDPDFTVIRHGLPRSGLTTDAADRRHLDRRSAPRAEREAFSLRVAFGFALVRTLEDRQQVLDHAVTVVDKALWGAPAVGLHY
ncbi:hypothetical protein LIER_14446 [Lithospermum erythrorhizon]|uniref:Uncharacterized protein n=1 Tax=Lithospermum erythrorhizon TaxID=34254 RepID=A0AAV3Q0T4_LITER